METMKTMLGLFLVTLMAPSLASAQEYLGPRQDFLTDHEIESIREAQDPNLRIERYLHFAKLRLELVRQRLAKEEPGRSQQIHRNLEEYGRIIETIDIVIDDALDQGLDINETMSKLTGEEEAFLGTLQQIADNPAEDHFRYEFVLEDAIFITEDSIEMAQMDLGIRTAKIREADRRAQDKREASMTPALKEEVQDIRKEKEEKKQKRPTLLKPGETLDRR